MSLSPLLFLCLSLFLERRLSDFSSEESEKRLLSFGFFRLRKGEVGFSLLLGVLVVVVVWFWVIEDRVVFICWSSLAVAVIRLWEVSSLAERCWSREVTRTRRVDKVWLNYFGQRGEM